MNKFKKCLSGLLQASLLLGAAQFAVAQQKAPEKLVFGISQEVYPPFSYTDSKGNWTGFEPDLVRAVCKQMQVTCTFNAIAWDGLIPALNAKQIDVILNSVSITDERKKVVDFTDAYLITPSVWIGEKGIPMEPTSAGLKGKKIGVQNSTTHAVFAKERYGKTSTIRYYADRNDIFAELRSGRIDIMLIDQMGVDELLALPENSALEIKGKAPQDPLFGEGIGAVVRKGDNALRERLNQAFAALRENGQMQVIAKPYISDDFLANP